MNKHTPGPWVVNASENGLVWVDGDSETVSICDLYHRHKDGEFISKENVKANARLISAAPDMYEALSLLMRIMQAEDPWDRENLGSMNEACMKARAALSKAEGGGQ